MQGTLVPPFRSSAVCTVFLPRDSRKVSAKPNKQACGAPFDSGSGPLECVDRCGRNNRLLNHGQLRTANDKGCHRLIIFNHGV